MKHCELMGHRHGRRHHGHFHRPENDAAGFDGWGDRPERGRAHGCDECSGCDSPDAAMCREHADWHADMSPAAYERAEMPDATPPEKLFELFHRAAHLFPRGPHHEGGMHPGQSRLLAIIADKGRISQREVMDMLQVRSASLSELLHKLERHGYIIREKDDADRRNVILSLSERGEEAYRADALARGERMAAVFSALEEQEQEQLAALLTRLLAAWHAERDGKPARRHGPGLRAHPHGHHRPHHHPHHRHRHHDMGHGEFDDRGPGRDDDGSDDAEVS